MNISLRSLFHLIMQLFPLILVCFFVIMSIFDWDFRGSIYLVGLAFALFILQLVDLKKDNADCKDDVVMSIITNHWILGYTIGYLFLTALWSGIELVEFIPVFAFFSIHSIIYIWLTTFSDTGDVNGACYKWPKTGIMYLVSSILGGLWAGFIELIDDDNLKFFKKYSSGNKKCTISSKKYKCQRYKNGILQSDK